MHHLMSEFVEYTARWIDFFPSSPVKNGRVAGGWGLGIELKQCGQFHE